MEKKIEIEVFVQKFFFGIFWFFFYLSLDQCFGYFFVFLVAKPSNPAPNCGVKFDFSLKNHFFKKKIFLSFFADFDFF